MNEKDIYGLAKKILKSFPRERKKFLNKVSYIFDGDQSEALSEVVLLIVEISKKGDYPDKYYYGAAVQHLQRVALTRYARAPISLRNKSDPTKYPLFSDIDDAASIKSGEDISDSSESLSRDYPVLWRLFSCTEKGLRDWINGLTDAEVRRMTNGAITSVLNKGRRKAVLKAIEGEIQEIKGFVSSGDRISAGIELSSLLA